MTKRNPVAPPEARRKRALAFGALLAGVVGPAMSKKGAILVQILPHWPAICPLYAAHAVPEKVTGTTLHLAATTASVQAELAYISPSIIEGVNTVLGYAAITQVRSRVQGATRAAVAKPTQNLPPSSTTLHRAQKVCQNVGDTELREALTRLAAQTLK
jgi:hypothetical protein